LSVGEVFISDIRMRANRLSVLRFKLSRGDSLMLMSDGIAEAQKPDRELFGFNRISESLGRRATAASLVTAAQDSGHEDDITVLTIARTAFASEA
jgi:serine phosphatase RsbU (regulator of sigma subunit)